MNLAPIKKEKGGGGEFGTWQSQLYPQAVTQNSRYSILVLKQWHHLLNLDQTQYNPQNYTKQRNKTMGEGMYVCVGCMCVWGGGGGEDQ